MSEKNVKVRFTENRIVDDCRKGTPQEESYKSGKIYSMPESSATRWILRGCAELATTKAKVAPKRDKAPEDKADDGIKSPPEVESQSDLTSGPKDLGLPDIKA